ncbi:MAG: response regulator [Anaerolineae bacterium]|nr:response regulator [Anaerolineae bacterium]
MTIRVLIVDPDLGFTVPIKRALEQSGDYVVNAFSGSQTALEIVQRETQDVAILDFNIEDMELPALIAELRQAQPNLFILASPRTNEHINQLPDLDIQGSITKPYLARQLVSVIHEAIAARTRLAQKERERRLEAVELPTSPSEKAEGRQPEPAAKPQPDDVFFRLIHALQNTTADKDKTAAPADIEEPPIPENATIRDLVSGQPLLEMPPSSLPESDHLPEQPSPSIPEPEPAADDLAVRALGAALDDTVPMDRLALETFIVQADKEWAARSLPPVGPAPADLVNQTTLVGLREAPAPLGSVSEDTQPEAGVVQKKLEADRQPVPPAALPDVAPAHERPASPVPLNLPPMLEQPSFVSHIPDIPVETPPTAFPPAPAIPEAQSVVTLAVQLTQLTVNSTAQATLLSRGERLLASAGHLSSTAIGGVFESIKLAWQGAASGNALIRYIHVPGVNDFLLYSIRTIESMTLSMVFPAETPVKVIRQQARQLIKALESVPEPPPVETAPEAPVEAEAASTLVSRPTDLQPPEGLHEAIAATEPAVEGIEAPVAPPAPPIAEGPYTNYAFVWLSRKNALAPETIPPLNDWINSISAEHRWKVDGVEVQPSYVTVQVSIPANETPTATVEVLMRETASRASDPDLWADAYYIVSPGRAVTQQEIANFMEYRREAQDAA